MQTENKIHFSQGSEIKIIHNDQINILYYLANFLILSVI